MSVLSPFHLLEINVISVQDIAKVSKSMRTYAVAWVHPDRKLKTRVDSQGGINPTWNDKFIFRVDNQFLKSDTSAIMIEIYALHWFKDIHVGTVRVLIGNIIPPQTRSHNQNHIGMRFVALQVRRRSGRPQGILNIGVTVLDSTMRSMPLYTQLSASAVGYQTLMGQDERYSSKPSGTNISTNFSKFQLRRSKSERSSMLGIDEEIIDFNDNDNNSVLPKPNKSIINGSDLSSIVGKKNKFGYDKPLSVVDVADASSSLSFALKLKTKELGKSNSVLSFASSTKLDGVRNVNKKINYKASRSEVGVVPALLRKDSNLGNNNVKNNNTKPKHNWLPPIDSKKQNSVQRAYPMKKAGSIWSESEVGPSPSEVAAAMAEDYKYRRQLDDGGSSMLDDKWTVDESEGVRTKLERWRTEMPPLYDYNYTTDSSSTIFGTRKHSRRHTYDGGKFSCFSNICGLECSIVCGKGDNNGSTNRTKKGVTNKQVARAPSINSVSTYF
ncbi:hypothetical protein RND81_05G154700 [Saponaria officinalis]|uniref:C2 domain-containing protein n=1 Tax=Saponaria officinalis TaxID=3572 RepID=A0AAW1KTD8_SAPOF